MQGDFHVEGYDIEGLLGAGSTGELWLARDQSSGEQVALRRFRPRDEEARRDARRIVNLLEGISHPGLLRVREMVQVGEEHFVLILGYAAGGTLDDLLTARGTLHPGEVATIVDVIADALATVHQCGVVHGDVTPESIVFSAGGRPLLTDIGLLPLVDGGDTMGTLGFTDPAALGEGKAPTAASDVYGLAAVCYTALSGATLDPQQRRQPLHQVAPGVPPGLAHAVEAGLSTDPAARPAAGSFGGQITAAVPAAPLRFPEGGVAPTSLPVPGSRMDGPGLPADGLPADGLPAAGPAGGGPGPDQPSGPSLFGRETPLAQPSTSFTPPRTLAEIVGEDEDDEDDESPAWKRKRKPSKPDRNEARGGDRGGLPRRRPSGALRVALVGVPVLLLLVIGGYVAFQALAGSNEPEGREIALSGPDAAKWAEVLAVLDQRISIAYEAGEPKKLNAAYKPGSDALKEDQQRLRDALVHWDGIRNFRTPVLSLHVESVADDQVVLNVVSRREDFTAFKEGKADYWQRPADPHRYRITLTPDGKGGWVYWAIQQIPMGPSTSTPDPGTAQ